MSQASERTVVALLVASAWLSRADAVGLNDPECEGSVCRARVDDKSQVVAPCEGNSLTVGYSQSSGATVIQCANLSGTAEENPVLLFDRNDSSSAAYEFLGARLLTLSADDWEMFHAEGVPDKFGPKPLCHAGSKPPGPGEFLIGVKHLQTGDHPEAPYCFDMFLVSGGDHWSVSAFSGQPVSPVPAAGLGRWKTLSAQLTASIDETMRRSSTTATGRITAAKAALYPAPDSAASKMYLIQGDRVEILDTSKQSSGWLQIRYRTKTGKTLVKWLRRSDVEK